MLPSDLRPLIFVTLAIALSLVTEARTGKILNLVTFPAIALTLVLKTLLFGLGAAFESGLVSSVLGMVVYPGLVIFLFRLLRGSGLGMGAIMLMAALGAAAGFRPSLVCAAVSVVVGVAIALVTLWRARGGQQPKVMGSPLVAAALVIGVPVAALLRW